MGIDSCGLEALLLGIRQHKGEKGKVLTLGQQDIHISAEDCLRICYKHGVEDKVSKEVFAVRPGVGVRDFFARLGFQGLDVLDMSNYEGANLLHDMNLPLTPSLLGQMGQKYSLIFDGGTTEHVFNVAQVFENILDLLDVGGIFVSVTVNNNLSGHGFYQFSPEFFAKLCSARYGMALEGLWLAKIGNPFVEWIRIHGGNLDYRLGGDDRVYVITIARKVSETRLRLLQNPPQQGNYEEILWHRT